jgi:cold shock CspA family protein
MVKNIRYFGTVQEFNPSRGIGYINMDETANRVLVRYSAIMGTGLRMLQAGQRVSFELEETDTRLSALRVIQE